MLFSPSIYPYVCNSSLLITALLSFCVMRAYYINALRSEDDPNKRDYHIGAVFMTIFGWPLLLVLYVGLFLLRAVMWAVFILTVTVGLIVIRKPFLLAWLEKICTKVGNTLLEWNTALLYAFLGREFKRPQD